MKLLEAAARAAGDVGKLWAEDTIKADILAKREARLRQYDIEDREDRQTFQSELASTKYRQQRKLADLAYQRQQGEIADTFTGTTGYYGITRGGDVREYPQLSGEVAAGTKAQQAKERREHLQELEKEMVKGLSSPDLFSENRESIEQNLSQNRLQQRLLGETDPEKRQRLLEEAEIAALKPQAMKYIQMAKENGWSKSQAAEFQRSEDKETTAKAVEKYWAEVPDSKQTASSDKGESLWSRLFGGESDQGRAPKPNPPANPPPRMSTAQAMARGQKAMEGFERPDLVVPFDQGIDRGSAGAGHRLTTLKDIAKKAGKKVTPEQMAFVQSHYAFIRTNLANFDPKEIRRFNIILDQAGAPKSKRFPED